MARPRHKCTGLDQRSHVWNSRCNEGIDPCWTGHGAQNLVPNEFAHRLRARVLALGDRKTAEETSKDIIPVFLWVAGDQMFVSNCTFGVHGDGTDHRSPNGGDWQVDATNRDASQFKVLHGSIEGAFDEWVQSNKHRRRNAKRQSRRPACVYPHPGETRRARP